MGSAFCAHCKITYPGRNAISNVSFGYSCHCQKVYFPMIQSDLSFFCEVKVGGKQTMYRGHGGGG